MTRDLILISVYGCLVTHTSTIFKKGKLRMTFLYNRESEKTFLFPNFKHHRTVTRNTVKLTFRHISTRRDPVMKDFRKNKKQGTPTKFPDVQQSFFTKIGGTTSQSTPDSLLKTPNKFRLRLVLLSSSSLITRNRCHDSST